MAYASINPYTGRLHKPFTHATDDQIDQALAKSHDVFLVSKNQSFAGLSESLQRTTNLLKLEPSKFAQLLTLDMGENTSEALGEVKILDRIIEFYANNTEALLATKKLHVMDPSKGEAIIFQKPIGTILATQLWNYPYYQVARILAPQLTAGNNIQIGHLSNVPLYVLPFEDIFLEAGLLTVIYISIFTTHRQIETIINDDRVQSVALTSSVDAGSIIASQAEKH
jgi:succinate-semialdehyde dehydrogenase/glutarate-semialdehyde dehydrogenase